MGVNGDSFVGQPPETEATATEALLREASSSLNSVEDLAAAAAAIADEPTQQLAAEALEAVERLTSHLATLDQESELEATEGSPADAAPVGACGVEGCGAPATRFIARADGDRLAVCARCAEELGTILS